MTVGASTLADERAYFSNYGKCVDIFAPGLNIQSSWIGSRDAVKTISGTSMASPHVAGLLAYFLSLQPSPDSEYAVEPLKPNELKKHVIAIASPDKLDNIPDDTVNLLLWNGGGASNLSEIWKDTPSKDKKKSTKTPSVLIGELEEIVEEQVKAIFDKARGALSEL